MINVQKFQTLDTCLKRPEQTTQTQIRLLLKEQSDQDRIFLVCYSDKHFINSSHDKEYFVCEKKVKSVQNFRTFTVILPQHMYWMRNKKIYFQLHENCL